VEERVIESKREREKEREGHCAKKRIKQINNTQIYYYFYKMFSSHYEIKMRFTAVAPKVCRKTRCYGFRGVTAETLNT
jgi:hypothetical protein